MTSVVMIVKVIKNFKVNDEYFIRCYDNGFFMKCLISKEQNDYLDKVKNDKSLYIITGYYVKYRNMIIIKVDSIEAFDYKSKSNICNIDNKAYDLNVFNKFESVRNKKRRKEIC